MKLSEKAQSSINKVIAQFQAGDLSAISKVVRIQLDPAAPAYAWSLSNKVLAFIQAGELDCRGFHQWQELGRTVRKGSRAVYIIRPLTIKKENEDNQEERICIGFSAIPIFAASDTEGKELPYISQSQDFPPLLEVAKKFGINVAYVPVAGRMIGDTDTQGVKIRLGSHDPRIFFHELAHAIHARIEGELQGGQHTDQETIAEFTAAVLMDFYGLGDNTGNAWNYIAKYSTDPLTAITKALGTVEKILSVLLESE